MQSVRIGPNVYRTVGLVNCNILPDRVKFKICQKNDKTGILYRLYFVSVNSNVAREF